jgi:hypothetical protein
MLLLSRCGLTLAAPDADDESWVDDTHQAVTNRAGVFANWADDFFGNPQSDIEAASSIIRLRPQWEWDERDGTDLRLRATGRLRLPQLSKRTSLVFQNDEGDPDSDFYDPALVSDGDSTVGIQYEVRDKKNQRVDLVAGLKSGPKGKLGARYRYLLPLGNNNQLAFTEELFWIGGDGFGSLTRFNIDRSLNDKALLRWANKLEYSEESNGMEWNTRLAWLYKVSERGALRVFGFVRGESDPEILKSRGFGIAYRQQFLRKWLHWEVEPRYAWRKRNPEEEREGLASVSLRLEITFDDR